MRSLESYFAEYSESHRNAANQAIHCVAVPLILWSIQGFLSLLPLPVVGNAAALVFVVLGVFYVRRSLVLFVAVLALMTLGQCLIAWLAQSSLSVAALSAGVFVMAWVAQFIGHSIEGAKPAFVKDLLFLLVGPGWVLAKGLAKLGIAH